MLKIGGRLGEVVACEKVVAHGGSTVALNYSWENGYKLWVKLVLGSFGWTSVSYDWSIK